MAKPKGWVKEPVRHGLAAKGVKTGQKNDLRINDRKLFRREANNVYLSLGNAEESIDRYLRTKDKTYLQALGVELSHAETYARSMKFRAESLKDSSLYNNAEALRFWTRSANRTYVVGMGQLLGGKKDEFLEGAVPNMKSSIGLARKIAEQYREVLR